MTSRVACSGKRPMASSTSCLSLIPQDDIPLVAGRKRAIGPEVKSIGMDVLRHRVAITYEAEAEEKTSENVIQKIFDELPVP